MQKGKNLAPKDKSGTSDPYLVLNLGDVREATGVVSKTLNPEWNQTFEFPVVTADSALLEVMCWDKDRFRKDYMGEFDVILEELFQGGYTALEPKWFKLEGRRTGRKKKQNDTVTGEVLMKFTLYDPMNTSASPQQILQKFSGVVAEAPGDDDDDDDDDEELLSRLSSREDADDDDDDDDEDKDPSDETEDGTRTPSGGDDSSKAARKRQKKIAKLRRKNKLKSYEFSGMSDVAGVLFLEINRITDLPPEKNSTRTTFDMDPFVVTSLGKKTYRTRVVNHNLNPVYDEKLVFQVQKHEVNYHLSFAVVDRDKFSGNDFVGTCTFPVDKVSNLAPEADPDTGLYKLPDPDGVAGGEVESRRKKFRLPMSRSTSSNNISRNSSSNNLHKLTRTTSSNSLKGEQMQPSQQPMRPDMKRTESENDVLDQLTHTQHMRPPPTSAPGFQTALPTSEPQNHNGGNGMSTAGASAGDDRDGEMHHYELPLELKNKQRWQDKHHPMLYIKAKYLPYRALRQQFWRAMLKQYDADESGKMDKVELITMLDTLGSTLHNSTIDGFFARWKDENKRFGLGEERLVLTIDQAVICLEEQLMKSYEVQGHLHRPHWERTHSSRKTKGGHLTPGGLESSPDVSPGAGSPYLGGADGGQLSQVPTSNTMPNSSIPALEVSDVDVSEPGESDSYSIHGPTTPGAGPKVLSPQITRADSWGQDSEADLMDDPAESREEHVVEIHECPICHMPRLNARSGRKKNGKKRRGATDADIITHIATCASSDWRAVNNLVMAGFVTSSQAQRKWYVTRLSSLTWI